MAPTGRRVNGLFIAQERLKRGYTQAAFAARLGIHTVTMNRIENGRALVSLELMEQMASELDVPRDKIEATETDDDAEAASLGLARDPDGEDAVGALMDALRRVVREEVSRESVPR